MITQKYLKECFDYNPFDGVFIWKKRPVHHFKNESASKTINTRQSGNIAGCIEAQGYVCIVISRKVLKAHRLAWLYMTGSLPKNQIDHINGDRADNRFKNLREVTNSENQKNSKVRNDNSTGIIGVHYSSKEFKWVVQATSIKKRISIRFDNLLDACCARKSLELKFSYHKNYGAR